jgi:hypothetical protein
MGDSPELLAAVKDVVEERGWIFVGESHGVYTAELPGTADPTVSTASAAGLITAIDSYKARQDATKAGWPGSMPYVISGRPLDVGDVE